MYRELFSNSQGKFKLSRYKGTTVIVGGSSTLVTLCWTVIFFCAACWKIRTLTQRWHMLWPCPSCSCIVTAFPVFLMDMNQNPLPTSRKFEEATAVRESRRFHTIHLFFPIFDISSLVVWLEKDIKETTADCSHDRHSAWAISCFWILACLGKFSNSG